MSTWPFKILVKYTSRGRTTRFLEGLDNIFSMCSQPDYIRVLITADLDDPQMNNDEVKAHIAKYKNAHVIYGVSENKIHAINRDLDIMPDDYKDWDILANFSDDQRWTIFGWDDIIRVDFNSVSPDFSHYMAYLDPDTHGALSTLLIAGRKWIEAFGFIYDPIYVALFCDNQVEDCAKHLGKYHYTGYSIYQHFNPAYGYEKFEKDEMFEHQQRLGWSIDMGLYHKLQAEGVEKYLEKFDLKSLTL